MSAAPRGGLFSLCGGMKGRVKAFFMHDGGVDDIDLRH
jgi:hypothetical protein